MNIIHTIARAYIEDDEYILLAVTKTHYFLPGGHVKVSESIKNALKREINEEMGIDKVDVGQYMGTIETIWDNKGNPFQELSYIFNVKSELFKKDKMIKSKENHIFFEWVKISDLEKINFLPSGINCLLTNYKTNKSADFLSLIDVT